MSTPTPVTPEIFDIAIARLEAGETLRAIAADLGFAPSSFRYFARSTPELSARYARAREEYAFSRHDRLMELANTPCGDSIQVAQLRILVDAEKWSIARTHPKVFGDKVEQTVNFTDATPLAGMSFEEKLAALKKSGEKS